jgi:hypothetical protein
MYQAYNLNASQHSKAFGSLLDHFSVLMKHRGALYTINYIKSVRLCLWNYLAKTPLKAVPGVRVTSDGLPVCLGALIPLIRGSGSPVLLRFLNTLLVCTRALKIRTPVDTSSITLPPLKGYVDLSEHVAEF